MMKKQNKSMKSQILFAVLLAVPIFFLLSSIGLSLPYDLYTHATEALANPNPNIDVRQLSWWEALWRGKPFSIATQDVTGKYQGDFYPGETVNFHIDTTSWNVVCNKMFIVAEVYVGSPGTFVTAQSKSMGGQSGGNNYYVADIPWSIPSSETRYGVWSAAGYLWCSDTTLPDVDGNGKTGQGEKISNGYTTTFNIRQKDVTCTPGFIGETTCRSDLSTNSGNGEDVYRLYRNSDCSSQYKRTQQCNSNQVCSVGACINGGTTTTTGTGSTTTTLPEGVCGKAQTSTQISVTKQPETKVVGNQIITTLSIKNTGTNMASPWLIEQQPRPKGQLPLQIYSQEVCDPTNHPENVNVRFQLQSNEENTVTLTSTVSDGCYDVYLLSRDKCCNEVPVGNTRVPPYPYSALVKTIAVGNAVCNVTPPWTWIIIGIGGVLIVFGGYWMWRKK